MKNTSIARSKSGEALFSIEFATFSSSINSVDFIDSSSARLSSCFRSLISLLFRKIAAASSVVNRSACASKFTIDDRFASILYSHYQQLNFQDHRIRQHMEQS